MAAPVPAQRVQTPAVTLVDGVPEGPMLALVRSAGPRLGRRSAATLRTDGPATPFTRQR